MSSSQKEAAEVERLAALDAKQIKERAEEDELRKLWAEEDAEEREAWWAMRQAGEVFDAEPELTKEEMANLLEAQYQEALKQVRASTLARLNSINEDGKPSILWRLVLQKSVQVSGMARPPHPTISTLLQQNHPAHPRSRLAVPVFEKTKRKHT